MLIFEITKTNTPLPQKGLAPILIAPPHTYPQRNTGNDYSCETKQNQCYTMSTLDVNDVTKTIEVIIIVTLDHKTFLKSLGYICSDSKKYIVWVKIIDFSFMPKIIRILSKDHVP